MRRRRHRSSSRTSWAVCLAQRSSRSVPTGLRGLSDKAGRAVGRAALHPLLIYQGLLSLLKAWPSQMAIVETFLKSYKAKQLAKDAKGTEAKRLFPRVWTLTNQSQMRKFRASYQTKSQIKSLIVQPPTNQSTKKRKIKELIKHWT